MGEREIWAEPFGRMNDLIACYLIHRGMAKPANAMDDDDMIPDIP